jgi:hypothetical protein
VHVDGLQLRYVQKLKRLKIGINTDDGLTKVRDCWLDSPRRLRRSSYSTVDDCLTRVRSRHDSRVPSSQAIDHDWPRFIHSSSVSNAFRLTTHNSKHKQHVDNTTTTTRSCFCLSPPSTYKSGVRGKARNCIWSRRATSVSECERRSQQHE